MKRTLLLLVFLQLGLLSYSQSYISKTQTYTTKDGLSSDKIYSLHKDALGFIWIGTDKGLNRFDGKEFKAYSLENQFDTATRTVQGIFEDDNGFLWLLKKNEIYDYEYKSPEIVLFNIHTEEITSPKKHFGSSMPFEIKDIGFMKMLEDGQFYFYCNTSKQGYTYSASSGFKTFNVPTEIIHIDDMVLMEDGNFLIKGLSSIETTNWTIYKADKTGNLLAKEKSNLAISINGKESRSLVKFQGSNYVKGGFNLDAYNYIFPNLSAINKTNTTAFEFIDQTNWNKDQELFWLKSQNQIRVIQPYGNVVFQKKEKTDDVRIPILFDGNTTWLSNRKDGLMAIQLEPNYFTNYQFFEEGFDNSTRGICQDRNGKTWVSTIIGHGQISADGKVAEQTKRSNICTRFAEDAEGNIWYFDGESLMKHQLNTNQSTAFRIREGSFTTWSLLVKSQQEVWLSGFNGEIIKFNPQKGKISGTSILPNDLHTEFNIYEYLKRDENSYWLCTNQGLYVVDGEGKFLSVYNKEQSGKNHLPTRAVHHIYKEENGIIWLATGDAGLLKLRAEQEEPVLEKQYTIADGLSSNALHVVYEDEDDYLWISSDNGLMQFDKRTEKVYKYYEENGIAHNEFNRIAHFQSENGQLYFGGLLGVTTFHPENFAEERNHQNNAPLSITAYQQFSSEKEKFEDLTTHLRQSNTISLQPSDQFFNLKVALLDYQSDDKITYQYRVNGLYDWQTNATGELSISGLPYGNHTLEIKAHNRSQQEAKNRLAIAIQVLRPFYLQWWFLIALLGGSALGIWLLVKRRTRGLLLQQEAAQLKELDQMKSRFFTNIAHELRTPLTLIGLPIDHLLKNLEGFTLEEMRQYLQSAKSNQRDLNQMVNEILDLSKLESGKLEINNKNFTLKAFIERIVNVFQTSAETKEIQFRFSSFISEKLMVESDLTKLEMVINNLLSNALKFTPKKGIILVDADWQNGELLFKIQDNGRGIPADDLPHVFDRYFQTSQDSMEGGSGIGLAICKEMLELMGGNIHVSSTLKEGSTFRFNLPMNIAEEVDGVPIPLAVDDTISATIQTESPSFSNKKSTILIVEDHPQLRQHLEIILSPKYNILTAENGKAALEILETNHINNDDSPPTANHPPSTVHRKPSTVKPSTVNRSPALILSDVMMPEMDGYTLLEKVKKDDRFFGIPFVLLTARGTLQDKLHGLRIGVDAYMTKPFEEEELLLRIQKLLEYSQNKKTIEIQPTSEDSRTNQSDSTDFEPSPRDVEWLKEVETIALREVRNKKFMISDLAKAVHLSQSQMSRRIKKITGLSPNRYIRLIRLHQAKQILETEKISTLTEVAYAVGFDGVTHFNKLFEEEFGKRPHEYLSEPI